MNMNTKTKRKLIAAVAATVVGLPAYIGYLTHRRWPTCLPCPSCGRTAPRDRPTCCHCHHDFPAPAANGTEVFAESISVL